MSDGSQRQWSAAFPTEAALYDARFEHDACGIGFLADLTGRATHKTLDDGLRCLERLAHRGAFDADGKSGDGAGVLTSIPHTLLNRELERVGRRAQRPGDLAVGMLFLPRDPDAANRARESVTASRSSSSERRSSTPRWSARAVRRSSSMRSMPAAASGSVACTAARRRCTSSGSTT